MSKRKTGALRKKDPRFTNFEKNYEDTEKTYYTRNTKTVIDFNQAQQKHKPRKQVELIPKSVNQEKYILALTDNQQDVVVASGPAIAKYKFNILFFVCLFNIVDKWINH